MPKTQGSRNYNQEEQRHLLATIEIYLPTQKSDWDDIAERYNSSKAKGWKERNAASLKRKFACMYLTARRHQDGDVSLLEEAALDMKLKIAKHTLSVRSDKSACSQVTARKTEARYQIDRYVADDTVAAPLHAPFSTVVAPRLAAAGSDANRENRESGTDAASLLPDRTGIPTYDSGDSDSMTLNDGRAAKCALIALPGSKDKHLHCDAIQLFLWFQRRDTQQLQQWRELQQQKKEVCAADRRYQEILDSIESLKSALTI